MLLYTNLVVTTNQNRYTHTKREREPNITLKIVIKSQGKRTKQEERNQKELQKQPVTKTQNGGKHIHINNYFKYKSTQCSNQKT